MSKHIYDQCERQGFSRGGREEKIRTHFQLVIGTGTQSPCLGYPLTNYLAWHLALHSTLEESFLEGVLGRIRSQSCHHSIINSIEQLQTALT